MSSNDYIKFMTEQFVKYANSSKEERLNQKQVKKSKQDPFLTRMFGMLPLAIMLMVNRRKRK